MSGGSDREGFLGEPAPELRRYTLHLDFLAVDGRTATHQAEAYAVALNRLRNEVDCYAAWISPPDNWARISAVFCGAPGPDSTDVCVDTAGHPGGHHGPGASHTWATGDLASSPETIDPTRYESS